MIRLYVLCLLALALGAAAANFMIEDNGYVLVSWRRWLIETSLLGLVAALVVGIFSGWALLRLLFAGVTLPASVRRTFERRRQRRARESFERGLLKLLEGNWRQAEVELVRRAADHHAPHLNYLAAARAAQRLGAGDRRDHYLRLAAQNAPQLELATLLTRAELQRERGEPEAARDTALTLRERDPAHPYAIELLAESYAELGAWEALRRLLLEAPAVTALPAARYRELLSLALRERVAEAVAAADLESLKALWQATPTATREDREVRAAYVRGLARLNAHAEALALVTAALDREWDAELAALYGELHAGEPLSQLAATEAWLNRYGEQPELLVTAGRACLRNKLWGKARSYLEAVTRVAPSPAAYLELARLCEQTQNREEAERFYRQGLELAAQA